MSSKLNVNVRNPDIAGDEEPLAVLWGTFYGQKEKVGGAFYLEVVSDRTTFHTQKFALFDNKGDMSSLSASDSALMFRQAVQKKEGANNSLKKSDYDLCREVFREYIFKKKNTGELKNYISNSDTSELTNFFDRLFSNYIRKGQLEFDVSCQLISPGKLENSMGAAMRNKGESVQKEKSSSGEKSAHYHRISLVTSPLKGRSPGEINPGDELYVRAIGSIASKFPDDLQSEKYENTTVPLEATVEAVKGNPSLPADYDGNSADYVEIDVIFGNGNHGRGYAYKDERIKMVHEVMEEVTGVPILGRVLLASGLTLALLAVIAWIIIG
ncbi:MAG: hypothetical protein ACLFN5_06840 [bacterium]